MPDVQIHPQPVDRVDIRAALLAAARAELVEQGQAGIGLRAVARRAGVSHAAPKHHFGDRAGLLAAVAAQGFDALREALTSALDELDDTATDPRQRLAALGRAYVAFGLQNPALFDLMFRRAELDDDDPALNLARQRSIGVLNDAVKELHTQTPESSGAPDLALISWALAHGLVVLARDGALQAAAGAGTDDQSVPLSLIGLFSSRLGAAG